MTPSIVVSSASIAASPHVAAGRAEWTVSVADGSKLPCDERQNIGAGGAERKDRSHGQVALGSRLEVRMYPISRVAAAFGMRVSALRYYDEIGLAPASQRRAKVRFYSRDALRRLAYARLLVRDGQLGVSRTLEVLAASRRRRTEIFAAVQGEIAEHLQALQTSLAMLRHLSECNEDDFDDCPMIREYLDRTVEVLLDAQAAGVRPDAGALTWLDFHTSVHSAMADRSRRQPEVAPTAGRHAPENC